MNPYKILLALLLSPPLSALAHTATTVLLDMPTAFNVADFLHATIMLAILTAPISYGATILIGIPIIYILIRIHHLKLRPLLTAAFFLGASIPVFHAIINNLDVIFALNYFAPKFGLYGIIVATSVWYISGMRHFGKTK